MELSKAELKLLYGYIRKMSDKFDFMGQEMTVEEADVISKIADEVCSPAQKLPDDGMVYEDEDGMCVHIRPMKSFRAIPQFIAENKNALRGRALLLRKFCTKVSF